MSNSARLNLRIPPQLSSAIAARAAVEGFDTASDYVRELLKSDLARKGNQASNPADADGLKKSLVQLETRVGLLQNQIESVNAALLIGLFSRLSDMPRAEASAISLVQKKNNGKLTLKAALNPEVLNLLGPLLLE